MHSKLSLTSVLSQIDKVYSPKLVANLNKEYDIKVAKVEGPFIWHSHHDTDEFFYVLSGSITIGIEGENGEEEVKLGQGELFVVPRGVRHRPDGKGEILLIERCGVINTGDAEKSELTNEVEDVRS
ncbi:RmlC-like cupin domain-containing protein [Xylogone sp. PMI_703]|nr:RmlC-like cupin domain-containing protein [Xylogone sp. PMI_703]